MSAFTIFEDESIDELLQACESLCKTAENGARLSCNMLRRNTVGLRYKHDVLIEEFLPAHSSLVQCKPKPIRSQIIGGVSNFSMHYDMQHDDSDRPGKYDAINLVGDGRYGVVKRNQRFGDTITANPLGTGQFSSVFNAIDMYTYGSKQSISVQQHEAPATLAIKIVDRKFKILALREIAFLKFINYRHSGSYFCRLLDSFCHLPSPDALPSESDYCILMHKYDLTLSAFIPRVLEESDVGAGVWSGRELLHQQVHARSFSSGSHCLGHIDSSNRDRDYRCHRFLQNIRYVAQSLLTGCYLLHSSGIIHGDIKPDNIFIRRSAAVGSEAQELPVSGNLLAELVPVYDYTICLGDFGSALCESEIFPLYCRNRDSERGRRHHTASPTASTYRVKNVAIQPLSYRAPEVLLGEYEYCYNAGPVNIGDHNYDKLPFGTGIDIWSVGIILLELCLGHNLFSACSSADQIQSLADSLFVFPAEYYSNIRPNGVSDSKCASSELANTFTAPASLHSQQTGHKTDAEVDIEAGFRMPNYMMTIKRLLLASSVYRDIEAICSPMFTHFLAHCLHPLPEHRLSALGALQHPYVAGVIPAASIAQHPHINTASSEFAADSATRLRRLHSSKSVVKVETDVSSGTEQDGSGCTGIVLENTLNSISALMNNLHSLAKPVAQPQAQPQSQPQFSSAPTAPHKATARDIVKVVSGDDKVPHKMRDYGHVIPVFEALVANSGTNSTSGVGAGAGEQRGRKRNFDDGGVDVDNTPNNLAAANRRRRVIDYTEHSDDDDDDDDTDGDREENHRQRIRKIGVDRTKEKYNNGDEYLSVINATPVAVSAPMRASVSVHNSSSSRMTKHTNAFEVL